MTRTQIINSLIAKNKYESYLEIGVNTPAQPGYNWNGIVAKVKHGVDPAQEAIDAQFRMTSDEFFEKHIQQKYDIIFVDGLHLREQVYKDIINSLNWLNDSGTIVVHDCNPVEEITQLRNRISAAWHGDVWKAIVQLRIEETGLSIHTVNSDEGCGIIQKGSQDLLNIQQLDEQINDPYEFKWLAKYRNVFLNLISVDQFVQQYLIS